MPIMNTPPIEIKFDKEYHTLAVWDVKSKSIIYNEEYWGKGNSTKLQNMLDILEVQGTIPKGCNFPEFISTHEVGHPVWSYLNQNYPEIVVQIMDIILEAAESGELRKFCKHATESNIDEAFCDIYAAIYCQPIQDQPEFVRDISLIYFDWCRGR